MTYEEYNEAERENLLWLTAVLILILRPYVSFPLTDYQWFALIESIYPFIEYAFNVSATNARTFYDAERRRRLEAPVVDLDTFRLDRDRHDFTLPEYEPEYLVEAMASVKDDFQPDTATAADLKRTVSTAVKEARSGGRRTIRRGTGSDLRAVGWARVEGGGSSCAFCLMLISRGPVYKNVNDAGLKAADAQSAIAIYRRFEQTGNDEELMKLMNRWHNNCDCRVVPVFDRRSWPGRDQYLEAEALWARVTKNFTGGKRGGDKLKEFRKFLRDGYPAESAPIAA